MHRAAAQIQVTGGGTPPPPKNYTPGSRSLGDPLFPQTGNGGYDAQSYDIELDYDPILNDFESATTTMMATATQDLSSFSLDFQDLDVSAVTVNGAPAAFTQELADPPLGDPADGDAAAQAHDHSGDPDRLGLEHRGRGRLQRHAGAPHRHRQFIRGLDPGLLRAGADASL